MSYLTSTEIETRTGILYKHFLTFSSGRYLTVHKEPIKTVINVQSDNYYGYGPASNQTNFNLTPVSGRFPAMSMKEKPKQDLNIGLQSDLNLNTIVVKVTPEAHNYISSGKNELFEIDGLQYNEVKGASVQNYLGLVFYYYKLERAS